MGKNQVLGPQLDSSQIQRRGSQVGLCTSLYDEHDHTPNLLL